MQSYEKVAKSYKAQSVQTASPGKLVLMLFDGYLRFTTAAKQAWEEVDIVKKNEGINNNLIRAQNIVTELQSSLDMTVPGDLPGTLYRLYDYVLTNLQQANLSKGSPKLKKLIKSFLNFVTLGQRCSLKTPRTPLPAVPNLDLFTTGIIGHE